MYLARAENRNVNERLVCTSREFFNASLKTHKKSSPVFFYVLYWFFTNLTKKLVGGILKKMEMPDSVGRLHSVTIKPPHVDR